VDASLENLEFQCKPTSIRFWAIRSHFHAELQGVP
jgi:hypothetical protein